MSAKETFDAKRLRWQMRRPDGRSLDTATLPTLTTCGVCCKAVPLGGVAGRIVCPHCGAHVVTVIDRETIKG